MQTYSHLLVTAVLRPKLQPDETKALLAGSVLPDVPLALLSIGYVVDRRCLRPICRIKRDAALLTTICTSTIPGGLPPTTACTRPCLSFC